MLGFAAGEFSRSSPRFVSTARKLIPVAVAGLAGGYVVVRFGFYPDPMAVPEPRLLFILNKTYLSPGRLLSLACLVIAFHLMFPLLLRLLYYPAHYLCALGRQSLAVFGISSLLALLGQILRFLGDRDLRLDIATLLLGVVAMGLTAWFVEQKSRSSG